MKRVKSQWLPTWKVGLAESECHLWTFWHFILAFKGIVGYYATTVYVISTDILNKIKKLYEEFTDSEKKVEAAKKAQEASRKTRENVTLEFAKCRIGEMDKLERKVKDLSVANLNEKVNEELNLILQFKDEIYVYFSDTFSAV